MPEPRARREKEREGSQEENVGRPQTDPFKQGNLGFLKALLMINF